MTDSARKQTELMPPKAAPGKIAKSKKNETPREKVPVGQGAGKRAAATVAPSFSALGALAGKNLMIVGGTGFLGRIMLYMLLKHVPDLARVTLLIRPTHGRTGTDRLRHEILGSPVFTTVPGDSAFFERLCAQKVEVVDGDAARPGLGLDPATTERLAREVDLVLNTAGNVEFNPPLDQSLGANTLATRGVLDFVEQTASKKYVHISTCYVADRSLHRDLAPEEIVSERVVNAGGNEVVVDVEREIADALASVEEVRGREQTSAEAARYRERAASELRKTGKEPSERLIDKIAKNIRAFDLREELVKEGQRRAARLNRPNVYTYTKTLAELLVKSRRGRIDYTIVRPSIVETSLRYPFPGWNEGIQGTAPLIYVMYRGHIMLPSLSRTPGERREAIIDIIPVDQVAAGTILACAALLTGRHREVYQLAAGPCERPITPGAVLNITQVALRDKIRSENSGLLRVLRENIQGYPVSKEIFDRFSSPRMLRFLEKTRDRLDRINGDKLPPAGAKLLRRAGQEADKFYRISYLKNRMFEEFMPFVVNGFPFFANWNGIELFGELSAAEQELFPFDPRRIDYLNYLAEEHMDAVVRWIFPVLEKRFNAILNTSGGENTLEAAWEAARELFRPSVLRTRVFSLLKNRKAASATPDAVPHRSAGGEAGRVVEEPPRDPFAFVDASVRAFLGDGSRRSFREENEEGLGALAAHLELLTGFYFSPETLRELGTVGKLKKEIQGLSADRTGAPAGSIRELITKPLPVDGIRVPRALAEPTRDFLREVQMHFYRKVLRVEIHGARHVPEHNPRLIVVANHASHLDYGLVWYALGDYAKNIGIIAARDYFFNRFWKSTFFHNFHNLIPLDRDAENYGQAFGPALEYFEAGTGPLLIFPEGTRSPDGTMQAFRQGLGYLVQKARADVLPVRLAGTHDALPKGKRSLQSRDVSVHIGPVIPFADLQRETAGFSPTKTYHSLAKRIEQAVRVL